MKLSRTKTLQSAKYIEQKRKKNITIGIISSIVFFLTISLLIFIFRLSIFQINNIEFSGLDRLDSSILRENVLNIFSGYYLSIIPRSSSFFYSKDDISRIFTEKFKRIEGVSIENKGQDTVIINIRERQATSIVCNGFKDDFFNENEVDNDEKCYLADATGYIFDDSNILSDGVYIRYYINSESSTLSIGSKLMDVEKFKNLNEFIKAVQSMDVMVKGVLIGDGGNYELYFKNKDDSTAILYFDEHLPFDQISKNFVTFWKNSSNKNFEYINLRFGNNIFFIGK